MELTRLKYSYNPLRGIEAGSRLRLAKLLRASTGTITPQSASTALNLPQGEVTKLLARWATQGWLQRVRRGIYVPVPLESERADSAPEDAWVIAETAFSPCFIAGWSAAEYWSLTEQVFRSLQVSTARRPRKREQKLGGISFVLRTVPEGQFFGLKTVWRGRARVQVTDPSRTMIDLLADPATGGGMRSSADMLEAYLRSKKQKNIPLLLDYAEKLDNGAVYKRLGFLLSRIAPDERDAMGQCAQKLSAGYAKLDPSIPSARLVTAWRLWIPEGW